MSFFTSRRQTETEAPSADSQPPRPILPAQPIGFETVFGANCVLEGTLKSGGNVRIDGTFTGTLDIVGNILVGETAKISADIDARNISIAGAVRGNVTGNKVQILRTGRVWGDIHASALTMEEGAFLDGKITMQGHQATQSTSASASPSEGTSTHAEGTDAHATDQSQAELSAEADSPDKAYDADSDSDITPSPDVTNKPEDEA